ncbi:unnamed protein product, partial [Mesorhabditis spiculigera]
MLVALAQNHSITGSLFLGLKRNGDAVGWTDGSKADYMNWDAGEPADGKDCAYISFDTKKWRMENCKTSIPYSCLYPAATTPAPSLGPTTATVASTKAVVTTGATGTTNNVYTVTQGPSGPTPPHQDVPCLDQWVYLNLTGMCYWHSRFTYFDAAESLCVMHGGHLASVHSWEENEFLKQLTWENTCATCDVLCGGFNIGSTFLGGFLDTSKDTLTWLDGTPDDFRGNVCQSSTSPSMIMLRSYPTMCSSPCFGGDWWPMDGWSGNATLSDFVCKAPPLVSTTIATTQANV